MDQTQLGLIGLIGHAGSGKDTVADHLVRRGFTRIAFADAVRNVLLRVNPLISGEGLRLQEAVEAHGWDRVKREIPEVRVLLQGLGAGVRDTLGESTWLDHALHQLDALHGPVVVTDVRYHNEALALRSRGFTLVWIRRPGVGPANSHVSETGIPVERADVVLTNAGSIQELHEAVDTQLLGS